jgi:hypothetical protein
MLVRQSVSQPSSASARSCVCPKARDKARKGKTSELGNRLNVYLVVGEIAGHGQDVVLDVSQVQADLGEGGNLLLLIAALRKP